MFSYLLALLQRFRAKPVLMIALAGLALLIASVLLTSFVRWLRRRREDRPDNWVGLVTGSAGNVLKVLAGLAVLAGLCLHLKFQATEFSRLRGGTSQRNYEAVKTIWGRPHIQRELDVALVRYTTKYFNRDGLEFDPAKLRAATRPIAYRRQKIEQHVPGNAILEADHEIRLAMNYRTKGNASYPGFELDCGFSYVIANLSGQDVVAKFTFPLPSRQGLVDRLTVTADRRVITNTNVSGDAVRWRQPLAAGQKMRLFVGYHSRGLDHIRLTPGSWRELRKYRVRMQLDGVAVADLNYPIGCMTPTRRKEVEGGAQLEWDLEHAVTRLGMGVILPKQKQAGYYVAKVLSASPRALVLLVAMVLVTHLATGRPIRYVLLVVLAASFCLYYLLMAHLGDYWPGLVGGMVIAGVALAALTALVQFARSDRFSAATTLVMFVLLCGLYPLIIISEYQGLLLTVLYVALLAYVIALLIRRRRAPQIEAAGGGGAVPAPGKLPAPAPL